MEGLNRSALLRRAWLLSPALALLLARSGTARASTPAGELESQIKAAYLYKFAGFVEWPESSFAQPDSALLIGVAGNDVLAEQLARMTQGRSIGRHPLLTRRVQRGEALAGLHILFIGASERAAVAEQVEGARGLSVLTVSDHEDSLALGCMIAFVASQQRLRFDVALKQVNTSGLRISARMLAAANRVQGAT